jgi:hypothetical protein
MFRDWYIFYSAGRAILDGASPYGVVDYFNPIQAAWLLAPSTFLPFEIWVAVMIALSFLAVILLCRKNSHWTLLSFPFVFGMIMGSLDLFLWVPARLLGGVGLALITLKPQLAVFLVPLQLAAWWREDRKRPILAFLISAGVLWGIPILIQPGWIGEWLGSLPSPETRLIGAATLAGFGALTGGWFFYTAAFLGVVLALLLLKKDDYYLAASFSPAFWPSDWIIAAEYISWRFVILSWLLIPTGIGLNGAQFYFLLGFLVWGERNSDQIKAWLKERFPSLNQDI